MTGDAAGTLTARLRVERGSGFDLDARLDAAAGETVAVMGPSGAGKSTLLAALAGLAPLTDGEIRIDGRVLSTVRRRVEPAARGTVLLGQDARLFPHLTIRENVAFGLRARRVARAEANARADDLIERVGLAGAADRRPAALSGGQQQRVAVARALAAAPRLVLLDEPLTSLDSVTASAVRALLAELLVDTTCVVVTHDAVDAVALADRLVVLEAGRVTQEGGVREVLAAPATPFVAEQAGLNRVAGLAGQPGVAVFPPSSVRLSAAGPDVSGAHGSGARGIGWRARVVRVEQTLGGVRVVTAEPQVACDLTLEEWARHPFAPGDDVHVSVDAGRLRSLPG
ncbi:ATP-binding cassette domain-containing protein [Microbacterium sp. SORGH_AS_0888]|uniref:ATP-binding cassette domain-containing protein n=1 Tax=Microbacterium sp. SORGH_AS_0888 TaxID=3041791 RepID=UPI0027D80FA9|nr:ATP-binding cassette domain-containing protein [Microbacterium sp. SORGH_AS_0888]